MPLFINCGTTKNIEKSTFFVYRLYTSAILHLIRNVFFMYRNFGFDRIFGEYIVAHLWEHSSGADNRFDYGYAFKRSKPAFC